MEPSSKAEALEASANTNVVFMMISDSTPRDEPVRGIGP